MKQARVPLKYLGKLLAISHEIVNKVPPNFVITGNMDICQHVQIKCFKSEQFQVSLDPIVLIKKATTSKRLKE